MTFEEKLMKVFKISIPVVTIIGLAIAFGAQQVIYKQRPQPIDFSHSLHAGKRQISCVFCHTGVKHGTNAGVPSVQDCMQCHQVITPETEGVQKKEEIQKLTKEYWEKKQPIEWFKVYNMPEHVRFSHKAHINAKVACTTCHGDVTKMDTIIQARNFVMGECVSCHRQNKAPTDCTTCHK